ncbi:MAG: OmpA family protein, partial [Saprospiraceae bacterium]
FIDDISLVEVDSMPKEKPKVIPPSPVVNIQKDTFTINGILFQTGSATLSHSAHQELDILIQKLTSKDIENIKILGHTDNTGSTIANQKLSENRAKSVFDYLIKNGINPSQTAFEGHGSSLPLASNTTKTGRAQNRRVEIIISSSSEKVTYSKPPQFQKKNKEPYLFSKDIIESPIQGWEYSRITNYQKAIQLHSSTAPQTVLADTTAFAKHQAVSAHQYILAQTQKHQITLINEAHHFPQNRAFITELLPALYQQGYRYIGFEALSAMDSLINQRKYPLLTSGDMTKEPLMGDLVRRAMQLGFTVFDYEADYLKVNEMVAEMKKTASSDLLEGHDFSLKMNARDQIQAENIAHFIKNKPNGKVLIVAGFDHIRELSSDFWSPMAYQLQKITGINPLTIDQTVMIERKTRHNESIFYKKAVKNGIKKPTVFIKNGQSFIAKEFDPNFPEEYVKFCDIQVFHPRTNWSRPRPTWMSMNGYRRPFKLKISKKVNLPSLAMVFRIGEDVKTAVPMDVIELQNKTSNHFLMLPKGTYLLIYKNEKYEIVHKEVIEVN